MRNKSKTQITNSGNHCHKILFQTVKKGYKVPLLTNSKTQYAMFSHIGNFRLVSLTVHKKN